MVTSTDPARRRSDPVAAAERRLERIWADADSIASLPDADEAFEPGQARALAAAFELVRDRASGRRAAPWSWLPAPPVRIATALGLVGGEAADDGDWATTRRMREAFVDLQAFLPDDEATAGQGHALGPERAHTDHAAGAEALYRIGWAQALAISFLRDDERVVGAHAALRDADIAIGEGLRALEVVDAHKAAQAVGLASIVLWPASVIVGGAIGVLVAGLTICGLVGIAAFAASGIALGPVHGSLVGRLSSRLERRAMRSDRMVAVRLGRWLASITGTVATFGVPGVVGLGLAMACARLGMP